LGEGGEGVRRHGQLNSRAVFSLDGRIALVTGASRGLGWGYAQALARAGALVVLNARSDADLAQRCERLRALGQRCEAAAFDVTDHAAVASAVSDIVARHGAIDIVVANAGIAQRAAIVETATDSLRQVLEVNLVAVWHLAREAAKAMMPRRHGRIILVGSIVGELGRTTLSAYTASKGAVHALARQLAAELAPHGITVNTIAPGYFETELSAPLIRNTDFNAWVCDRTPAGRWGRIEELGPAAVFLASDEASFITGQTLCVDGGLTTAM
jgi:gluconate 5-dehydrogenase